MTDLSIEVDPSEARPPIIIDPMAGVYWSGKYLTQICDRCRHTHPALKDIPDEALTIHEIGSFQLLPLKKLCQLSRPGDVHTLAGIKLEYEEE